MSKKKSEIEEVVGARSIKQLRIGARLYEIQWRDTGPDNYGLFYKSASVIAVDPEVSEQQRRDTLLHEIIHGVLYHAGHSSGHDELLVSGIASGLCQVFRDNPELAAVLAAE